MRRCILYETLKRNYKLNASLKYWVLNFAVSLMISGDCSKSWQMHWKRLHRQAFFSIVVNGLPTGYWCSSGGCMSKSSCWRQCFFDTWPMNALETEHSNLEIDSKLNRQPVKTYKWRCDVFMSWQWAHQSDWRVLHPLELAKVRSGNNHDRLLQ